MVLVASRVSHFSLNILLLFIPILPQSPIFIYSLEEVGID